MPCLALCLPLLPYRTPMGPEILTARIDYRDTTTSHPALILIVVRVRVEVESKDSLGVVSSSVLLSVRLWWCLGVLHLDVFLRCGRC